MTGGGIDFKIGSMRRSENILIEPESELGAEPEPNMGLGLGVLGAKSAPRLERQR